MVKELKKVIGIISWLPDDIEKREKREKRLQQLFKSIGRLLPNIDVLVIAQNWKEFTPSKTCNKKIIIRYENGLGILKARNTLREEFLKMDYDYIIMFDDDAIPSETITGATNTYLKRMNVNPEGFAFIRADKPANSINPYCQSQLNFCAISRYIYEKEGFPQVDPQKNEGYEDELYSSLLHYKYGENEFSAPKGVKSVHFKNPKIKMWGGDVPSTWAHTDDRDWSLLSKNTDTIEKYIVENHDLPENLKISQIEKQ